MALTLAQVRERYDAEERQNVADPNARREAFPNLVRYVAHGGDKSFVLYSRLDESTADAAIAEQVAYFGALNVPFEWKLFSYDTPADLGARLVAQGFELGDLEALLVLDTDTAPGILLDAPAGDVRRINAPEGIGDVKAVEEAVWGDNYDRLDLRFGPHLRDNTGYVAMYVAYVDDHPAASAWMTFTPGSSFAYLWGGSTLAEYRGRGLYTDLLRVRLREAWRRNVRFLAVDASPMSRPILKKYGFQLIGEAREANWTPEGK